MSAECAAGVGGVAKASRNRAAHLRESRRPARSLRQGFGWSQNLPLIVLLISGGPGNQRGVCGKVSGGRKTFRGMRGSFPGVPETSAECAARFRGVAKPSADCAAHLRESGDCQDAFGRNQYPFSNILLTAVFKAHFDYFFTVQRFYQLTIYRLSEEIDTFTHRLFFFVW